MTIIAKLQITSADAAGATMSVVFWGAKRAPLSKTFHWAWKTTARRTLPLVFVYNQARTTDRPITLAR